jgi:hypothetical protein
MVTYCLFLSLQSELCCVLRLIIPPVVKFALLSTFFMLKNPSSEMYCKTLKKLHRAIHNKKCGMPTSGIVLLHDNVCLHTVARTWALLEHFNWEPFDHHPYSPDLTPSNYHLFTYLKNWLGSQCFNNNEELMEGIKTRLSSYAADFIDTGIQKLIPWYDKCINSSGNYSQLSIIRGRINRFAA